MRAPAPVQLRTGRQTAPAHGPVPPRTHIADTFPDAFHEAAEHAGRNIVGKSAQNRVQVLFHRCGSILQLLFVLPIRAARPLPAKIFNEGRRLGMRNRQHSSR